MEKNRVLPILGKVKGYLNEKEKNNNHIGCDCSNCGNYSYSNEIQKKS